MAPFVFEVVRRSFDTGTPSIVFSDQWKNPTDVFSILLILGGDVIVRALAQLTGSLLTPVAFSFGWVAYAVAALVSVVGENKLMPPPDCKCIVINVANRSVRENSSWIIGRLVRDFESWADLGLPDHPVENCLARIVAERWALEDSIVSAGETPALKRFNTNRPARVGLCVTVYRAGEARSGCPGYDKQYFLGLLVCVIQLGIAAIPCGLYGDWGILLVTTGGVLLSLLTGALPQWKDEKWSCRERSDKTAILTQGNGSQHAIVIIGDGMGFDLEDLAAGIATKNVTRSITTRIFVSVIATFWILLLITATAINQNTWFLIAVGGVGALQNIYAAGAQRSPDDYGMPLKYEAVFGEPYAMDTLLAVEKAYPSVGRAMLEVFFPGDLLQDAAERWKKLEEEMAAEKTGGSVVNR